MIIWTLLFITLYKNVESNTTPAPNILPGEREWDCSLDHAQHDSIPGKFLQSVSGFFGLGATVVEASCATQHQVFEQENGSCRCVYSPELRALLKKPCHVRLVEGNRPQEYDLLVPSLNKNTIDELYVRRSCYSLLTDNVVDFFLTKGVNPLFFNLTGCRCDWTPETNSIRGRPVAQGQICERLVDQNFTSSEVSSDEVGNWISVYPYARQRDLTIIDGGTQFGHGVFASVGWGLMAADFKEINIVAIFTSTFGSTGTQTIYTNGCRDMSGSGGFIELSYSPVEQQYTLLFFKNQPVTCIPETALGSYSEQIVQVMYKRGNVKMVVNGFTCDVSSLNPITTVSDRRIQLNTQCPFQLGGSVFTDLAIKDFGMQNGSKAPLDGVYKRFLAVRNCPTPPPAVLNKIQGVL